MALADPQPIVYATVTKNLARTGMALDQSTYALDDSGVVYNLNIFKNIKKRKRIVVRLSRASVVTDPLVPANSIGVSMAATLTIDFPLVGLYAADAKALGLALQSLTNDAGFLLKVCNGEL